MHAIRWLAVPVVALAIHGCASAPVAPTAEQKHSLAWSGRLRVGFLATNPAHAVKDPASAEYKGPAVDLGREMARRLGVAFEAVPYTSFAPLLAGAKAGHWEIAMMGSSAERAQVVDFTAPYMLVEFSYLVPAGSALAGPGDIDRPGVRIAVIEKGAPDAQLSGSLKHAVLVRHPTLAEMVSALREGRADAVYGTRAAMLGQAGKVPGSRVLEGRFGGEEAAIALPKGRQAAVAYASMFVENVKAEGFVKDALDRSGLRGVVVAPPR